MSWKPNFTHQEPNIDPFNAPDPVMPGGEPQLTFPTEKRDGDDGVERIARRNERKEPGHFRHRAHTSSHESWNSFSTQNSSDGSAQTSPIQTEPEASPQAGGNIGATPSGQARTQRKQRSRRGTSGAQAPAGKQRKKTFPYFFLLILIIFLLTGGLSTIGSCVASTLDGVISIFNGNSDADSARVAYDDYSSSISSDPDELAEDQALETLHELVSTETTGMLDGIQQGDGYYCDLIVQRLDEDFKTWTGRSAEEAGIDLYALAQWSMSNMTYEVADQYELIEHSDSEGYTADCSIYFYLWSPNVGDVLSELSSFMTNDLETWRDEPLSDAEREQIQAKLQELMDEADPSKREAYLYIDYTGTTDVDGFNGEITFDDQEGWEDSILQQLT